MAVALGAGFAPALPACAADYPASDDFYLALHGGGALLANSAIHYAHNVLPGRALRFDSGWALVGAAGWRANPWLRGELEVGRHSNSIDTIMPGSTPDGSVSATSLMGNLYADLPVAFAVKESPVTPYIGAGFGKAWITHDLGVDGSNLSRATSWPWAWQVIAGASVPVAPDWSLGIEYRYVGTQHGVFQDAQGLFYHTGYASQSIILGLAWRT